MYTTYHTVRNLAKHAYELDDERFGAPVIKKEVDWPLLDPKKYLKDLKEEKKLVTERLDDLVYVMREHGISCSYESPTYNYPEAVQHCYHKFTRRSFHYVELISEQLNSYSPSEIKLNVSKALRQFNVAVAALEDIEASIIRYEAYLKEKEESK